MFRYVKRSALIERVLYKDYYNSQSAQFQAFLQFYNNLYILLIFPVFYVVTLTKNVQKLIS